MVRRKPTQSRQRCKSWTTSTSSPTTERSSPPHQLLELEKILKACRKSRGKKHFQNAAILNQIGNIYFRAGNNDAAATAYKEAIRCDPGEYTTTAYLNLGTVYWSTGDVQEAIPLLEQALSSHEMDVVLLTETANEKENSRSGETDMAALVYHQLGLCYALLNEFETAMDYMKRALAIRESLPLESQALVGSTLDAMGKIYFMQGDYKTAVEYHEKAARLLILANSDTLTVRQNLVNAYVAMGEDNRAIHVLGDIIPILRAKMLEEARSSRPQTAAHALQQSLCAVAVLYEKIGISADADACRKEAKLILFEANLAGRQEGNR